MSDDGDMSARQAANQRDRLGALYHLALELVELRDLQQVLDLALRQCVTLTGSQFGFIGLNLPDSSGMDVVAILGFEASKRFYDQFHLVVPLRSGLLARPALDNRPMQSADVMSDTARVGQPERHPPVHAYLGVPLRRRGLPIGMIGLANRAGGYAEEHEQLLLTYAGQVAIAIHNARLYDELRVANEALERAMIGQYTALRAAQLQQDVGLSDVDMQVLKLVAGGASNAQVGAALHMSLGSVKRRLQRIFDHLGVSGRVPAAAGALRRGLI
jgi:GAF domain-containing protein